MKKFKLFALIPLLFSGISLTACGEKPVKYNEKFVMDGPHYEPVDITRDNGAYAQTITIVGIPSKGIKQVCWDDYGIKLRIYYSDGKLLDREFSEKHIPLEFRHYLGEIGHHQIEIAYGPQTLSFDFEIIKNNDWKGFTCTFFDNKKKLVHTQQVGYYQDLEYDGPDITALKEDNDYIYRFAKWNYSTKRIHQDMQFTAVYEKHEKRIVAVTPFHTDHVGLTALVDSEHKKGSGLFFLGRIKHIATIWTDMKELTPTEDLELPWHVVDYSMYWNTLTQDIANKIKVINNIEYNSLLLGSLDQLIRVPNFASSFDSRYKYKGVHAYLDNGENPELSYNEPYSYTINNSVGYTLLSGHVSKDELPGYYRYAVVADFDIYMSMSFTKLDKGIYEIGSFNSIIAAPVGGTFHSLIQRSDDGVFGPSDDSELYLSTHGVYAIAQMIDW